MKPEFIPESFHYDNMLDTYSVDMVPDDIQDGVFRTSNNRLGRNITLDMIAVSDAEAMMSGKLYPLKKYIRLGRVGTRILTTGILIEDTSGKKVGISHTIVREYPGFKKSRKQSQ